MDLNVPDRIILGIVSGLSAEKVARACGVPEADVAAAVSEARRRLTLAAEYSRDEQLGTALSRLNSLYAAATSAKDVKTALGIQKELNRLTDLYRPTVRHVEEDGHATQELQAIRGHLLPVLLGPDTLATDELARLAVVEIMRLRHGADHPDEC